MNTKVFRKEDAFIKKIRKKYVAVALFFLIIFISIVTNPKKEDYLRFSREEMGIPTPTSIEIEKINFFIFSTYTPKVHNEYGITHLGVFNNFVQISDGQFDNRWWLDYFN